MTIPRPDLDQLVKDATARFSALPPGERRAIRRAQSKSWVVGEMLLEHPEMTREQAEQLYDRVCA